MTEVVMQRCPGEGVLEDVGHGAVSSADLLLLGFSGHCRLGCIQELCCQGS